MLYQKDFSDKLKTNKSSDPGFSKIAIWAVRIFYKMYTNLTENVNSFRVNYNFVAIFHSHSMIIKLVHVGDNINSSRLCFVKN